MPRHCTACDHPNRPAIDQALVAGETYRSIASGTGLSESALKRHKQAHLKPALRAAMAERQEAHTRHAQEAQAAKEAKDYDTTEALLDQMRLLRTTAFGLLQKAEQAGELRTAVAAVKEVRATLELLLKLAGELRDAPTVTIELTLAKVEVALLAALAPYPEARAAAAAALLELDTPHERL